MALAFVTGGRFSRPGPAALLLALAFTLLAPAAGATPALQDDEEQEWSLALYDVEIRVQDDGRYEVTERIRFDFRSGSFTFATRDIPYRRMDSLSLIQVTSPDLGPLDVTSSRSDGRERVRWEFDRRSAPGEVVLSYTAHGALREIGDWNEIFWAAIGEGWDVPVDDARVTLYLPGFFASEASELRIDPASDVAFADGLWRITFPVESLERRQAYQIRVGFPKVMPGRKVGIGRTEIQIFIFSLLLLLIGIIRAVFAAGKWRTGNARSVSQPPTLTLEEGAVLLHRGGGVESAIPATLLQLAREGIVTLVRGEEGNRKKDDDIHVEVARDFPRSLSVFEAAVLEETGRWESLKEFGSKGKKGKKALVDLARDLSLDRGFIVGRLEEARADTVRGWQTLALGLLAGPAWFVMGPWGIVIAVLAFTLSIVPFTLGEKKYLLTSDGVRAQEELTGWLRRVRSELKRTLDQDPIEAASRFSQVFPWLLVDPEETGGLGRKVGKALKRKKGEETAQGEFHLPAWLEDRSTKAEKRYRKETAAYAAFATTQDVDTYTTAWLVPHMAGSSGGASAASAAGAAGGGAAGGGGGGAG